MVSSVTTSSASLSGSVSRFISRGFASSLPALLVGAALMGCSGSSGGSSNGSGGSGGAGGSANNGAENDFFLPTGEKPDNTGAPMIAVDAQGFTHSVYPSYAGGGAYYAFCGAGCTGPDTTKVVRFETDGTVTNAMLALTSEGHPRVLLSAFQKAYYASCDAACDAQSSWTIAAIVDKGIDQDITGEAFALDGQNRPRFLMHTHVAYLGAGQKDPQTSFYSCDSGCTESSAWTSKVIATDIWQGSTLRFDGAGIAKVATVAQVNGQGANQVVYFECAGACDNTARWHGSALGNAFESVSDIVTIHPQAKLALTKSGAPRIVALAASDDGGRGLVYLSCDKDCTTGAWAATAIGKDQKIDSGYSLALDGSDKPHVAYTFDYNIATATCDDTCPSGNAMGATFTSAIAESSTDLPADQIFLNYNCTVGGWLFHDPSIALTPDGHARIGFQASDMSVGGATTDTTHGSCVAGMDMTWSRLSLR